MNKSQGTFSTIMKFVISKYSSIHHTKYTIYYFIAIKYRNVKSNSNIVLYIRFGWTWQCFALKVEIQQKQNSFTQWVITLNWKFKTSFSLVSPLKFYVLHILKLKKSKVKSKLSKDFLCTIYYWVLNRRKPLQ